MPTEIPIAPKYPVLHQLGTGQPIEHTPFQNIAELINYCAAELCADPLVEFGFNSGQGYEHAGGEALICRWRIPTLTQLHDTCLVFIEMESSTGEGLAKLASGADEVTLQVQQAGGRVWYSAELLIDTSTDFDDLVLRLKDGSSPLTIYSAHVSYKPLSSPLPAARMTQADGAYVVPIPLGGESLIQPQQPLSAGLGRLLLSNLKALRDGWRRMLWCVSGVGVNGYIYTAHPEDAPTARVRTWPGASEAGVRMKLWALLQPHATKPTTFMFLIDDRSAHRVDLIADLGQTPIWVDADLLVPEGEYRAGDALPSFEVGVEPMGLGATRRSSRSTNCAILSISLWGAI